MATAHKKKKLFHLYNAFQQQGLYFLGLSSHVTRKLKFEIRFGIPFKVKAQSAEIKPPDDELLIKVMAKRFFLPEFFKIDQDSLEYILLRMERSWDGLDRLVEKVSSTATALKKGELTKPLLRTVMTEDAQVDY